MRAFSFVRIVELKTQQASWKENLKERKMRASPGAMNVSSTSSIQQASASMSVMFTNTPKMRTSWRMYSKQQIKCFQFLRIPIAMVNRITRASEGSLRMKDCEIASSCFKWSNDLVYDKFNLYLNILWEINFTLEIENSLFLLFFLWIVMALPLSLTQLTFLFIEEKVHIKSMVSCTLISVPTNSS